MRRALALLSICAACRGAPALPDGVQWVQTSDDDPLQWTRAGFLELVTPVRPPTSADGSIRIVVLVRPPDGARLRTRVEADGAASVAMVPGATAIRVELSGTGGADDPIGADWQVLDARQFTWTASGLRCRVLRPAPGARLAGVEWACGPQADARAGAALAGSVRGGWLVGPADPALRAAAADRLARLNGCVGCHRPGRAEDRGPSALVQRATDADGLFSVRSLWSDEDPVERYRPADPNVGDPHLSAVCPGSAVERGACADGLRPRLRLAVARGLAAGDRHVARVCASREALAARLDPEGAVAVRPALTACAR